MLRLRQQRGRAFEAQDEGCQVIVGERGEVLLLRQHSSRARARERGQRPKRAKETCSRRRGERKRQP